MRTHYGRTATQNPAVLADLQVKTPAKVARMTMQAIKACRCVLLLKMQGRGFLDNPENTKQNRRLEGRRLACLKFNYRSRERCRSRRLTVHRQTGLNAPEERFSER